VTSALTREFLNEKLGYLVILQAMFLRCEEVLALSCFGLEQKLQDVTDWSVKIVADRQDLFANGQLVSHGSLLVGE
jgi:hypothetical protein